MDELRARLEPAITSKRSSDGWLVSVERPSLDGRNRLRLELRAGRGGQRRAADIPYGRHPRGRGEHGDRPDSRHH